ncbi:MAG TPA: chorismate synthase [Syntrophomonadaceae bacterium]|nr:chorismate synthase [Syntrophomonadaceae bacterium]
MLRFVTSGESHGKALVGIIEGYPAGITVSQKQINEDLARRQKGYGRGGRMQIEKDQIEIIAGVRNQVTLGSPVSFMIENKDYVNWESIMSPDHCIDIEEKAVHRPRPGHADLASAIKYNHTDMRNILERASARETATRVAAGSFFKQLLAPFGIYIYSQVIGIGNVKAVHTDIGSLEYAQLVERVEASPVRCQDEEASEQMINIIDQAKKDGESLGGFFEVGAIGVPPGLGSHTSWDRKLDAKLGGLLLSIPAIKAVEIGAGIINASSPGSGVHDQIFLDDKAGLHRNSNRAGGLEGGVTNGETVWARAYMKPIPTLYKPLQSVNTLTWEEETAVIERSDICAVPTAAVAGEAMLAFGIAEALVTKFGGDNLTEMMSNFESYRDYMKRVWKWKKT